MRAAPCTKESGKVLVVVVSLSLFFSDLAKKQAVDDTDKESTRRRPCVLTAIGRMICFTVAAS